MAYGRGGSRREGGRSYQPPYGPYGPYAPGYGAYPGYGPYGPPYAPPGAPYPGYGPYPPAPAPGQELDMLKDQADYLEQTLSDIKKRIEELEAEVGKK